MPLSASELHKLLEYDPETGVLCWRVRRSQSVKSGDVAGCVEVQGYRVIVIDGKTYKAHRIIWAMVTGGWPTKQIDHINQLRCDNRWSNLRLATQPQNSMNSKARRNKVKGVHWNKQSRKWMARVGQIYLGQFDNWTDAVQARLNKAKEMFGEFA